MKSYLQSSLNQSHVWLVFLLFLQCENRSDLLSLSSFSLGLPSDDVDDPDDSIFLETMILQELRSSSGLKCEDNLNVIVMFVFLITVTLSLSSQLTSASDHGEG